MSDKLDQTLRTAMAAYVGISPGPPDLPERRNVPPRRHPRPAYVAGLAFVIALSVVGVVAALVGNGSSSDRATDDIDSVVAPSVIEPVGLGDGYVWPAEPHPGSAAEVALAFADEVLDWSDAAATLDPAADPSGPVWVRLQQPGVADLDVLTSPIGGAGRVLVQVGMPPIHGAVEPGQLLGTEVALVQTPGAVGADITIRWADGQLLVIDASIDHLNQGVVGTSEIPDAESIRTVLVLYRDAEGNVIAAAGGHSGTTTTEPVSPSDPDPGSAVGLPLDWLSSLELGQRETDLYFGYMKNCMAEAGFAWEQPEPLVIPPEWAEITRYPMRYGVVTPGQAELAAYRFPEELFPGYATEEADKDSLPTDPAEREAFQTIWFGPEVELDLDDFVEIADPVSGQPFALLEQPAPLGRGCQGQANTWRYGEVPSLDAADITITPGVASAWVSTLIRDAFEEALVDQRVLIAAGDWRVCMEAKGWQLFGTWLPGGIRMEMLNPNLSEGELLTAELERLEQQRRNTELAIDDVGCQQDVGWFASLRTVEAERQQATVERVPDLLTEVRDLLEAYSARLNTLRLDDLGQ